MSAGSKRIVSVRKICGKKELTTKTNNDGVPVSVGNQEVHPIRIFSDKHATSTITMKHSRGTISSVETYPEERRFLTKSNGRFKYHKSDTKYLSLYNPNQAKVIPVLDQIESILKDMDDDDDVVELQQVKGTVYIYDREGIIRAKELVHCKRVKDSMEKGKKLLFDFDLLDANTFISAINQKNLETFWKMLREGSPNSKVKLNGALISSDSLFSLVSLDSCLSEDIIDHICGILNTKAKSFSTVVVSVRKINEDIESFVSEVKQMFGKDLSSVKILVYASVQTTSELRGCDHNTPERSFNHFVFAVYSVKENQVFYVDTRAKPLPRFMRTALAQLSKCLNKGVLYYGTCHDEVVTSEDSKSSCDNLYPYQSCELVGGLAVIIGMSIFTLDRKMFKVITGQIVCKEYAEKLSYLRDITSHSHFLRLVLVDWIMEGGIDLSQIYKKCAQGIESSDEADSNTLRPSPVVIKVKSCDLHSQPLGKDVSGDTSIDNSEMTSMQLHQNVGSTRFPKVIAQKYNTRPKTRKLVTDSNCDHGSYVLRLSVTQGHFSISFSEVHHLLNGRPKAWFKEKENAYFVECKPTKGGKKHKYFRCSLDQGRDDKAVLNQIQDFFRLENFLHWVDDDTEHTDDTGRNKAQEQKTTAEVNTVEVSDEFEPEVTIILNELATSLAGKRDDIQVIRKIRSVNDSQVRGNPGLPTDAGVQTEKTLKDSDILLPSRDVLAANREGREFTTGNVVRVGCSQGRIPVYFGDIKDLIIGRPVIAFRKKKCCYSLECTFYTGDTGYKNFSCRRDRGRDDLDTLKEICEFLKPKYFTPWLKENLVQKRKNKRKNLTRGTVAKKKKIAAADESSQPEGLKTEEAGIFLENKDLSEESEEETHICLEIGDNGTIKNLFTSSDSSQEMDTQVKPTAFDYEKIKTYIVGKPKVHFRKMKRMYRLECLLWNGRKVYKNFSYVPSGKVRTMNEIQKFLNSDEAICWVQNCDDSWIFQYEVQAGADTRRCLDRLPFDVKRHYIYDKNIVKPEYSKETSWVSVTENKKWGKTHRYDETYRIISSTAACNPSNVVAYVYLTCASKTNECRASCGARISSLTFLNNVCDGCGLSLDSGRECYHCKVKTSSQWYSKGEPGDLCATCYTYRQRKGCLRPIEVTAGKSKNAIKIHHEHVQCKWRMKLEMKLGHLNTWNVYESNENINYHVSSAFQENKKPALGVRDTWDKLRASKKATSLQIHSVESSCKAPSKNKEENMGQCVKNSLSRIKARCELVDKHKSDKNTVNDPYQMVLNLDHLGNESLFHTTNKNHKSEKQFQLETAEENNTRICGTCFEEGVSPPFTCNSKRDLDIHKSRVHNNSGDLCAVCYKEMGVVVRFEDSRAFLQHLSKHKIKFI